MDAAHRPCSAWNTARKANLSSVVQREWLYGYLSGMSDQEMTLSSKNMYELLPANEDIVVFLNNYCEQQPQSSVNQAACELFNSLRSKP
ncbi:MAG: hypothetical protein EXR37_01995 [Limnohabitans sp.]|nr:hypothetical protein [Limnohabitans sp.]